MSFTYVTRVNESRKKQIFKILLRETETIKYERQYRSIHFKMEKSSAKGPLVVLTKGKWVTKTNEWNYTSRDNEAKGVVDIHAMKIANESLVSLNRAVNGAKNVQLFVKYFTSVK